MDLSAFGDMNWFAAVGAGFVYFILGAIWFAPGVFGTHWRASLGVADDFQPSPLAIASTLATCLITAVIAGALTQWTGADGFLDGLVLGIVLGLGVSGAILAAVAAVGLVVAKPVVWSIITGGYHAVGLIIATVFVSIWS